MLKCERIEDIIANSPIDEYPELKSSFDDDGLLNIGPDMEVCPRGIVYKQHVLLFSDSLEQMIMTGRLYECIKVAVSQKTDVRVRIDEQFMRPGSQRALLFFQKEYWFGPKVSLQCLSDPPYGLTIHFLQTDCSTSLTGNPTHRTEFWRSRKNEEETVSLEVEDLVLHDLPENGVITKYDHALLNLKSQQFTHLDLAHIYYSNSEYFTRIGIKLTERGRKQQKKKLLRIDGGVSSDIFEKLIVGFHQNNPLIGEFLQGVVHDQAVQNAAAVLVSDEIWRRLKSRAASQ